METLPRLTKFHNNCQKKAMKTYFLNLLHIKKRFHIPSIYVAIQILDQSKCGNQHLKFVIHLIISGRKHISIKKNQ